MKMFLNFLFLSVSFLSFCQKELVYFPANGSDLENEIDLFLSKKNPESLINILKKEIKRSEVLGGEGQISFVFNSFGDLENNVPVTGLPENFFKSVYGDTSEMNFKGYFCDNKVVEGVGSTYCDQYYSLDNIIGIVFLQGISEENLKSLNESTEVGEDGYQQFYGQDRIGFVRSVEFKDKLDSNEVNVQQCITFSIPLSSVVEITQDKSWFKLYKNMKNEALKIYDMNTKISSGEIYIIDYKNIQQISNSFYHISSESRDLNFGLTIFNY